MESNPNENQIGEGPVITERNSQPESSKSNKGRIAFLFMIGFLVGVSIKAQALKTITMGYEDYKLLGWHDDFSQKNTVPTAADEGAANSGAAATDDNQPAGAATPGQNQQPAQEQPNQPIQNNQ